MVTMDDSMRLVVEAIQHDVSHEVIAEVVGVRTADVSDYVNEKAQLTSRQYKKLLRYMKAQGFFT